MNCIISGENNRSCYPSRLFHYALLHDNSFFHPLFNASGRINQFLLRKGTTYNNLQSFIRHFYSLISRHGRIHVCPVVSPLSVAAPSLHCKQASRTGSGQHACCRIQHHLFDTVWSPVLFLFQLLICFAIDFDCARLHDSFLDVEEPPFFNGKFDFDLVFHGFSSHPVCHGDALFLFPESEVVHTERPAVL